MYSSPHLRANLTAQAWAGAPSGSSSIAGWSHRNRRPGRPDGAVVPGAGRRRDPDYLEVDPTTRAELDVPLMDRGKVSGVLSIESDQPNAFDENDRTTLWKAWRRWP